MYDERQMESKLPNFLVLGTAKAGTSSIYAYLKQHPEIYLSRTTELNFFAHAGSDLNFRGPGDHEYIWQDSLVATYQDYCIPRAVDVPTITVALDDSAPCRTNPLGSKGCGESGAIGGPPCITNGVMDALSELGITQLNTPLTPQKVWKAIQDAKAAR